MIEFKGVKKVFGDRTVLSDISFSVKSGEILFILGTSGTGKSVLLKNIVGLMRPDGGEIWVNGERVDGYTEEEFLRVRRSCGMVFQQPALLDSLTVFENIAFGLRRRVDFSEQNIEEQVATCLGQVQLAGIEHKYPQEISYGMQKRVSLARTLAMNPKVLLFDEPTTGLDPVTTQAINQLIQRLSREMNTTSLVVSHDMKCALDIADRILVLDKGRVLESGTASELLESSQELVREFLKEVRA